MSYTNGLDKPSDYFDSVLYTGNTSTGTTISSLDFAPNMVWFKSRTQAENHQIYDSVRGVTKRIIPNGTQAEATASTGLTNFDSNGFRTGGENETDSGNIVAWNWKAGTSFTNDASATGIGTIDSNGSVSSDAGFGIVKWSGTGSAGTIAHNMGSTPSFLIIKRLSDANWLVQTTALGYGNYLALNTTDASASASTLVTGVSSTLVTLGNNGSVNGSGQDYIGYFFSEKKGYSKFGSYTANNNSDGTFIYTGFKPAFAIFKKSSGTETWHIHDNKRSPFNVSSAELYASENQTEDTNARLDLLSNGVKMRTDGGGYNTGSETYIYMAFAESPFVTSTGVPACAR